MNDILGGEYKHKWLLMFLYYYNLQINIYIGNILRDTIVIMSKQ